ncbi:steroid 17-alpha-hydroxylase/17,20 lyase [Exaiptasia diaphana]|uniref:Cytochrome P450 n=1 Tax=Exaiptasia diaphana TaxID=2652724 RepID=A0A913YSY2_EXADI|nr:steroid 17-alpha-hydroxylase/17,20 lyase [Exaiptasia diaphana]
MGQSTTVFINAWAIHLDEKEWEDPHAFNPERFLDDEGKLIQVAGMKSLLPFGAGRRVCVGEALAKQELFIAIARLLHQFKIEPEVPGSAPSRHGALTNSRVIYPEPFKVRFKSRQ